MGFSSQDDFINKITNINKTWRMDWNKITGAAAYTAGRWYDLSQLNGTPNAIQYGEHILNGTAPASLFNWTPNGTAWVASAGVFAKTSGTATTLTANSSLITPVVGRFYRIQYTISAWTSGTCTVSFAGATGTARGAAGTFIEIVTATNTNPLAFTASISTAVFSISSVSVVEWGASSGTTTPASQVLTDTNNQGSFFHGGNVSPDTKHAVNTMALTAVATGVPATLMLVDLLMCYPYIDANSAVVQNFVNNQTLPRYTNGAGVRAFLVPANTLGAVAHNIAAMSYTNQASTSGRQLPVTVAMTASAINPHISHSGLAAGNYGPFLPIASGDTGVKSVDSLQFSAASGTANTFYHLVLCKPLTQLPITTASIAAERDLINQLPSAPQIQDGACLGLLMFAGAATAASTSFYGAIEVAWG